MRPLTQDLSIFNKFGFEKPSVGVKFLFNKPEGIESLDKKLALCETLREAQERGTPFYLCKQNQDCVGTYPLGMEDIPPHAESGLIGPQLEIFQEPRANGVLYRYLPKFARGTVNYIAFSTLDKLSFEPDLLVLTATPSQAEIVLRAMSYSTGEIWETKATNVLGCAWLYVYPCVSGKVNCMVTGLYFGMKVRQVFPDGWMLISIPYAWIPIINQNLKEMKWILPAYTEEGRKELSERAHRMFDPGEYQNP